MPAALLTAAALALALGLAHSALGERYIIRRLLRRPDLPRLFGSDELTKRTLRFAWHLTSVAWWGMAAVFVALARPAGDATASRVALLLAATFGVSGALALLGSRGRHPSWLVFLAIAVAAVVGSR